MACYMYVLSSHQLNSHLKIRNFASLHPLCDRAERYVIQMAVDNYHWLVGLSVGLQVRKPVKIKGESHVFELRV